MRRYYSSAKRPARPKIQYKILKPHWAAAVGVGVSAGTLLLGMLLFAPVYLAFHLPVGAIGPINQVIRVLSLAAGAMVAARCTDQSPFIWSLVSNVAAIIVLHAVYFMTTQVLAPASVWFSDIFLAAVCGLAVAAVLRILKKREESGSAA